MKKAAKINIETAVIHVGNLPDKETGAVTPPIYQTSTYAQKSPGDHLGYEYTRTHNPTRTRLEECLAASEGANYAVTTASGMSAIMLMMHLLPPGSTVLCGDDVYGGTYRLFTTVFDRYHDFHFIDTTDHKLLADHIKRLRPKLLWLETPTNPMLKITDLSAAVDVAHKHGCKVIVDNTFMSPYFQNPIKLGADYVMHSMTKYINGHSDVVGGCIMLNDTKEHQALFKLQNSIGPCLSPFDSWLVLRGIKTLGVRMKQHQANAMELAQWLEAHPKVKKVIYPGLKSHPQYKIAKKQMSGFGGMISFVINGGLKESKKFLESVRLFTLAESLGGVESLIEHPAIMTHASIPKDKRKLLGIDDGLIRISVGIEHVADLKSDLENAFKQAFGKN
jgi:cystathionine gamma-lyase